ncbi:MAG: AraC family transcriptional regulator ligand-binding domain-containing protein [Myxococcaceae bacterium]
MAKSDVDFESRLVPLLLGFGRDKGVDPKPLIEKYRLPADVLAQQPGKIILTTPASTIALLSEDLAVALNDPHVGLQMAAWLPRGFYGVAEFLMRAGPTLRQSFENLIRFTGILAPNQSFSFETGETESVYHHNSNPRPGLLGRHMHEYTSAVVVKTLVVLAPETKPLRAWFSHPRPATLDLERLATALHTREFSFDAPTSGFSVATAALDAPVVGGDAALYSFLEEHALSALAARPKSDDLVDKLRHHIRDALKQGEPNIERLATRLSMSGRTLQRRLSDLKTSFQEVLDQIRYDLARAYLKDARLDVSQIAYLLGYSELRAFDRAFRRWADKSPTEWRAAS